MLRGIQFEPWVAPVQHWRNRMDVACFIGFARRRVDQRLPPSLLQWWREDGWIDAPGQRSSAVDASGVEDVVGGIDNLPVPIDDWSMFERTFEVRSLPIAPPPEPRVPGYLAAAVRSFFAQGGRRCIVVPIEHPDGLWLRSTAADRLDAIGTLLPELAGDLGAIEAYERSAWRGIGLLHALDDVATLCIPDLPWLVAQLPAWLTPDDPEVVPRAAFFECADPISPLPEVVVTPPLAIGRCDEPEYVAWSSALRSASRFLARHRRDVTLVAAVPLPVPESNANRSLVDALIDWGVLEAGEEGGGSPSDRGVASRFVQLVYPWIGWQGSRGLPEALEPADGALAGVLARSTLLSGAFRTAAGLAFHEIERAEPKLSRAQQLRAPDAVPVTGAPSEGALVDRVSLVGAEASRRVLLQSDVTSSVGQQYQLASIQRLHAVWIRALRQAGELFVFESSNENLWATVRRQLEHVGRALFRNGALRGESPIQAFSVRCDRTTMSQRDIDGGRLIAEIRYRPAAPIELIRIALALSENRDVTVVSESAEVAA